MNFEDRVHHSKLKLVEFLERYKAPSGLSEDAQVKTIEAISQAFGRKLPVSNKDGYLANIDKVFERVSDGHSSYAWPSQGSFVECMEFHDAGGSKAPQSYNIDPIKITAKKMNAGEAIAESFLWGVSSGQLSSGSLVSRDIFERYRVGSARHWSSVYGPNAEHLMALRYGPVVHPYFAQAGE